MCAHTRIMCAKVTFPGFSFDNKKEILNFAPKIRNHDYEYNNTYDDCISKRNHSC